MVRLKTNAAACLIFFYFIALATSASAHCHAIAPEKTLKGIYRLVNGSAGGLDICIVDGSYVRQEIYHEFLYGGNDERYLFIPRGEIWIDNSISAEEYLYTLAHELNERGLMGKFGYTYSAAQDSSLKVELIMRLNDQNIAREHELKLPKVSPTDCDGIKQIKELEDSIKLQKVYLHRFDSRKGVIIWVVDGSLIRKEIYPDFGLSGNGYVYNFIPKDEIWIDGQISCEETEFSIARELLQRELMSKGMNYDESYQKAIEEETVLRRLKEKEASKRKPVNPGKSLERDRGTGSVNLF